MIFRLASSMPIPRSLSVKRFVEGKSPPADLEGELLLGALQQFEALEQFARERMETTGRLGEQRGPAAIFISWPHDDNPVALSCSN
jgi:hypothetical protein